MKKIIAAVVVVLMAALNANNAAAENLTNKLAISGRIGFTVPSDSEWQINGPITGDTGLTFGVGLLYGVSRNLAAELEYTHSQYDLRYDRFTKDGTANVDDVSIGLQMRFPSRQVTPYLGAGVSILFNDYTDSDVNNTVGFNLKGGMDFFVTPQLALNGELRMVLSPKADMNYRPVYDRGSFDPSSFFGLFGIRYFFN
jgi:outer membrane protein